MYRKCSINQCSIFIVNMNWLLIKNYIKVVNSNNDFFKYCCYCYFSSNKLNNYIHGGFFTSHIQSNHLLQSACHIFNDKGVRVAKDRCCG